MGEKGEKGEKGENGVVKEAVSQTTLSLNQEWAKCMTEGPD
jgi:hypothetical protein